LGPFFSYRGLQSPCFRNEIRLNPEVGWEAAERLDLGWLFNQALFGEPSLDKVENVGRGAGKHYPVL